MIKNITIRRTINPEYGYDDINELRADTLQHIHDVSKIMGCIGCEVIERGYSHDWSKLGYFTNFANDTLERQDTPDFKSRNWYKIHTSLERHHINANVPENVNLIDILECIVDCIVAGKARTGMVDKEFLIIPDEVILLSYWNTVNLLIDNVLLEEEEDED